VTDGQTDETDGRTHRQPCLQQDVLKLSSFLAVVLKNLPTGLPLYL
jgi:hypothetical protein